MFPLRGVVEQFLSAYAVNVVDESCHSKTNCCRLFARQHCALRMSKQGRRRRRQAKCQTPYSEVV